MADIVEMLRTPAGANPPTKWELAAADEITRLRKALAEIASLKPEDRYYGIEPWDVAIVLARTALTNGESK